MYSFHNSRLILPESSHKPDFDSLDSEYYFVVKWNKLNPLKDHKLKTIKNIQNINTCSSNIKTQVEYMPS